VASYNIILVLGRKLNTRNRAKVPADYVTARGPKFFACGTDSRLIIKYDRING